MLANDLRDLGFTVSQTEDQSSRVCSPCSNQVRSTRARFSFIKASFQESEHDDDNFQFLNTAISRKVVGKSARYNPERHCGWFCVYCSSKKFERIGTKGHENVFASAKGKQQK